MYRHRFLLASAVFLLLFLSIPVLATEGEQTTDASTGEQSTDTSVAAESEAGAGPSYTPAVTVAEEAPAELVQPWTNRFLIPTMAALAVILLFATVVQYFLKVVRARYKVVE